MKRFGIIRRNKWHAKPSRLRAKADALWGKIIHAAYDGCVVCGKRDGKLDAHHLIGRGIHRLRHDPRNGVLLCSLHHEFDKTCSPHGGPMGFALWLERELPDAWEWIRARQTVTGGKPDYAMEILLLEQIIKAGGEKDCAWKRRR